MTGEIAYWKQVCMNALRQAQALNTQCEENKQRGDELEQHLQDLLQQQQKEKEERLSTFPDFRLECFILI